MNGIFSGPTSVFVILRLAASLCGLLVFATPTLAQAERSLLSAEVVLPAEAANVIDGQIEGACGVAVLGSKIYVSDYYHHGVDIFPDGSERIAGDSLDGPCGLAVSTSGALYANDWHRSVERLLPSPLKLDEAESTGVAVALATGNVYVDDRTYVAVYEPAGGPPISRIGLGSLGDGYGVAVSASGRVYVPDSRASDIKVYEPSVDVSNPVEVIDGAATPQGRFVSLVDAAVAVDPTNEHLVVLDDLQPGYEHPQAAIDEFAPDGAFLGQLTTRVIDGGPSGVAFNGTELYVTTGNSEKANVVRFGPYFASPLVAPAGLAAPLSAAVDDPGVDSPASSGAAGGRTTFSARAVRGGVLAARVTSTGTVSVTGPDLVPLRSLSINPGSPRFRVHLDQIGRSTLAKRHRLAIPVRVTFVPTSGPTLIARVVAIFRSSGRRNDER
jgi:hypothetical protein